MLDPKALDGMSRADLERLQRELQSLGPIATFPWHSQQEHLLRASTDVICAIGGNQSGKTTVGRGILSRLVRREGPIYARLKNANRRPLRIWVSPQTFEKYQSNWERQIRDEVFHGIEYEYKQHPNKIFTWKDSVSSHNEIWGKSQDQGFMAFESDVVDLIIFDEEPLDRRIYVSGLARLSTTNGVLVFTYTPLNGLTWTFNEFYAPAAQPEFKKGDRFWQRDNSITIVEMGMADNPLSVEGGGVRRIQNNPAISDAEKATRLYGKYGYTEGLVWKQAATLSTASVHESDQLYFVDALPGWDHKKPNTGRYTWTLCLDPNKRHGALLLATDHHGNAYVCDEHYLEGVPDRLHAEAYRTMLGRWHLDIDQVDVFADPGGAGAQSIVNLADHGIYAGTVPKGSGSVKASIELVRRALWLDPTHRHPFTGRRRAPHLYFLRSLHTAWKDGGVGYRESRLLWEMRQYRQKENAPPDTPLKENDDLVDCLRYHYLVRAQLPELPPDRTEKEIRERLDRSSRREHDSYDALAKRHMERKAPRSVDPVLGSL